MSPFLLKLKRCLIDHLDTYLKCHRKLVSKNGFILVDTCHVDLYCFLYQNVLITFYLFYYLLDYVAYLCFQSRLSDLFSSFTSYFASVISQSDDKSIKKMSIWSGNCNIKM